MTTKTPYSYTVLRYMHDVATGEFVNVGVVMFAPGERFLGAMFRTTFKRVKSLFPTLHSDAFKASMRALDASFKERKAELNVNNLNGAKTALDIATNILPKDDSSLQWSPVGTGVASNLEEKLLSLYARLVTKYDEGHHVHKRNEDDILRHFSLELQQRRILNHFEPKTLSVADDAVEFKHAWKNGVWHCLAPVSFDLASPESIKDKAHKWLGKLASVKDVAEECKLYFLIGEPHQSDLSEAVNSAFSILRKSPFPCEIYKESETSELSDLLAREIEQHESQQKLSD
jgi:hypothetical protein